MYFSYCENCKTKECNYKCTETLMDMLEEKNYKFAGCPDKEPADKAQELLFSLNPMRAPYILKDGTHCTADIRMMNDQNEELYLEIKRIPFAFESSKDIGPSRAYERIMYLIAEIFDIFDEYAETIRNNYTIRIERGYISEFDPELFYEQYHCNKESLKPDILDFIEKFVSYIEDNAENWTHFTYKCRDDIEISFQPGLPFEGGKSASEPDNRGVSAEGDVELKSFALCGSIITCGGFYFQVPANKGGGINLEKYVELIVGTNKLEEQIKNNFEKAKNSFYGVDKGRYVIHEIFFKQNDDGLYYDEADNLTAIGKALLSNIGEMIVSHADLIEKYAKCYDKSYLFLSIGETTYGYELF